MMTTYQKKKVLFVCNQNKNRSITAEMLFKDKYETKSAGLYCEGCNLLSKEMLEWADVVCVFESEQRTEISKRFPNEYMKKRILVLGIPDVFNASVKESKKQLKEKLRQVVNHDLF
jgi:predicted protein tyrosine phosphatase